MKTKIKINKACSVLLISIALGSLSGCSDDKDPLLSEKKQTLVDMINNQNDAMIEYIERIDELELLLKGVQGDNVDTPAISEIGDGTGRLTFNSVESIIKLPVALQYPKAVEAPNTSKILISEAVSIKPTSNWLIKMSGSKVEVEHPNGISGKISVGYLDREAQRTLADSLQEYLAKEFFSSLPPETVNYSRLHIKDTWVGIDATSHTFINSEDARIRCGILGFGEVAVQYMLVYKGDTDGTKDELISSLVNTIEVWNTPISVK